MRAWTSNMADIVPYMDIDLSTELDALSPLLDPIAAGETDGSIGSRKRRWVPSDSQHSA